MLKVYRISCKKNTNLRNSRRNGSNEATRPTVALGLGLCLDTDIDLSPKTTENRRRSPSLSCPRSVEKPRDHDDMVKQPIPNGRWRCRGGRNSIGLLARAYVSPCQLKNNVGRVPFRF